MTEPALSNPFDQKEIEQVHLAGAPLAWVLGQVRHPPLIALAGEGGQEVALQLADKLSGEYPVFGQQFETLLEITPEGLSQKQGKRIWQLKNSDESWRLTFGTEFIALETSAYRERDDFCRRLDGVLDAYAAVVTPPRATRVGLRYFNRIDREDDLQDLQALFRDEVLGPYGATLPGGVDLQLMLAQVLYRNGSLELKGQWGYLPAGATVDLAIPSIDRPAWVLDIDSYTTSPSPFQIGAISPVVHGLASQARRFFRWAVTDEYLSRYRESR